MLDSASESAPMPQPRSATWVTPAAAKRWACWAATFSRVASKAGLGEQHLAGELAELRLGAGAQPGLGQDGRDELGGVAGLAERGVELEGVPLVVGTER